MLYNENNKNSIKDFCLLSTLLYQFKPSKSLIDTEYVCPYSYYIKPSNLQENMKTSGAFR